MPFVLAVDTVQLLTSSRIQDESFAVPACWLCQKRTFRRKKLLLASNVAHVRSDLVQCIPSFEGRLQDMIRTTDIERQILLFSRLKDCMTEYGTKEGKRSQAGTKHIRNH